MAIASSKLTAQGQISVPAEVRRKLGLGPGSVMEWDEDGDHVVVRRAGTHTSEALHAALFPGAAPSRKSVADLKDGIRSMVKERYARR